MGIAVLYHTESLLDGLLHSFSLLLKFLMNFVKGKTAEHTTLGEGKVALGTGNVAKPIFYNNSPFTVNAVLCWSTIHSFVEETHIV